MQWPDFLNSWNHTPIAAEEAAGYVSQYIEEMKQAVRAAYGSFTAKNLIHWLHDLDPSRDDAWRDHVIHETGTEIDAQLMRLCMLERQRMVFSHVPVLVAMPHGTLLSVVLADSARIIVDGARGVDGIGLNFAVGNLHIEDDEGFRFQLSLPIIGVDDRALSDDRMRNDGQQAKALFNIIYHTNHDDVHGSTAFHAPRKALHLMNGVELWAHAVGEVGSRPISGLELYSIAEKRAAVSYQDAYFTLDLSDPIPDDPRNMSQQQRLAQVIAVIENCHDLYTEDKPVPIRSNEPRTASLARFWGAQYLRFANTVEPVLTSLLPDVCEARPEIANYASGLFHMPESTRGDVNSWLHLGQKLPGSIGNGCIDLLTQSAQWTEQLWNACKAQHPDILAS